MDEPGFGRHAAYLADSQHVADLPGATELAGYKSLGINFVAPPIFALLDLDASGNIVPFKCIGHSSPE